MKVIRDKDIIPFIKSCQRLGGSLEENVELELDNYVTNIPVEVTRENLDMLYNEMLAEKSAQHQNRMERLARWEDARAQRKAANTDSKEEQ